MRRQETELLRHFVLKVFDGLGKELEHAAARGTDHMIVMVVVVMMLKVRLVVAESYFAGQARLGQQF